MMDERFLNLRQNKELIPTHSKYGFARFICK